MKKKISTRQIGDGKLPNKYWVSICDDFLYLNEGCWDWDSDRRKEKNAKGKTVAVFNSYVEAKGLFDSISMGEKFEGVMVNVKTIEDRFSGELTREVFQEVIRLEPFFEEDLSFSKKAMEKLGAELE